MKKFLVLVIALLPLVSNAATLEIVNHFGAPARITDLFNQCQGALIPNDQPIWLQNGESIKFTVPLVMHHFRVCAQGFCAATAIQMVEGDQFTIEIVNKGGVIDGLTEPNQWGGPSKPCPGN